MKILCGIMGAIPHAYNGQHQASRDTWIPEFSKIGDVRFFIGREDYELREDEIRVNVPDTMTYILYKTVELLKWAIEQKYDMILKLDTDTYVDVDQLAKSSYSTYDYVGAPVGNIGEFYAGTNCYSFFQGSATWLSPKAAQIVIEDAIPTMNRMIPEAMKYNGTISPYPHAEDLWVAQALTPHIKNGYLRASADWGYSGGPLTYHFARPQKHKISEWMRSLHDARGDLIKMQQIQSTRGE